MAEPYLHHFSPYHLTYSNANTLEIRDRIPRWLDHLTRNSVFDGDNVFLHMLRAQAGARERPGGRLLALQLLHAGAERQVGRRLGLTTAWSRQYREILCIPQGVGSSA